MSELAVEFDDVTFAYPGALAAALERVTLRVSAGERLGILGPNGGGKSTLIKLMLGLLTARDAGRMSGRIRVMGLEPGEARRRGVIGYVPQKMHIEAAMPLSVREAVTLGAAWRAPALKRVPRDVRERVERMLGVVGALAFADRPVGRLSGGQLQRAMIARALAASAQVLALDEPTVGIDPAGQQMFADLLRTIHAELGVTILVVSHDLRAIIAGSDRIACLARRLHSHTSPAGLTPQILAEVFSHDVIGVSGPLAGMHVHAHGADEPCGHAAPTGPGAPAGGVVQIGLPGREARP
jgi:zinc transport system ATP-binding protein